MVNGNVTLSGVVDNQADKDVANIRANGVPGVFKVANNLQVAGSQREKRKELRVHARAAWAYACAAVVLLRWSDGIVVEEYGVTLEMIKWEHSIFALPFALTGAVLAAGGWPARRVLGWIVVCMVAARSAAMAFNRLGGCASWMRRIRGRPCGQFRQER